MIFAYVDTSCLVALALGEEGTTGMQRRLERAERLFAANLLEAEFRAAMHREGVTEGIDDYLAALSWILPDRPLTAEMRIVLDHGYLRGADLWHLACALFLAGDPGSMHFLTYDQQQAEVARNLGFIVP